MKTPSKKHRLRDLNDPELIKQWQQLGLDDSTESTIYYEVPPFREQSDTLI
ncbi:MAG: hypothetical protein MRY78_01485 [Saprospiraceae bacterium]|nr:hypothetical protein [Saprospiraceae bacterium]